MIEDDVVGGIVGLTDLLQDYCALALELLRVEGRVLQDVGKDIEGKRYVLLEHFRVVGRALARGVGIDLAADRLDLLGDRASASPFGAFEGHVLEKMRDAVDVSRFVPRTDIDPDAERDRFDRVDPVRGDPQTVPQCGKLSRHAAAPRRAWDRMNRVTALISHGSAVVRSGRSRRSPSAGGKTGRIPVARSTASGNLAGWAQPRAIIGPPP